MNTYFMGENISERNTIIGWNTIRSDYQDLIDQYKARGGKVTHCNYGERTTKTPIPWHNVSKAESEPTIDKNTTSGYSLFDQIERERNKTFDPDSFFDNKGE